MVGSIFPFKSEASTVAESVLERQTGGHVGPVGWTLYGPSTSVQLHPQLVPAATKASFTSVKPAAAFCALVAMRKLYKGIAWISQRERANPERIPDVGQSDTVGTHLVQAEPGMIIPRHSILTPKPPQCRQIPRPSRGNNFCRRLLRQ